MSTVTLANGRQFTAAAGVSILDAALAAGIVLEYSCRTARCGTCKAGVAEGAARPLRPETSLTSDEVGAGCILTCAREATTDLRLDIDDLGALASIAIKTLPCRIAALDAIAPDVLRVTLRLPPDSGFRFLAGQYIDVIGPGGVRRSYSIASSPYAPDRLELHVRRVPGGALSAYWFERAKVNDLLRLRGPLGTFFLREGAAPRLIFLATGTGIAPVQSILSSLRDGDASRIPREIRVYWGGRRPEDLYWDPRDVLPHVAYVPVLSRDAGEWTGGRGYVHQVLLQEIDRFDDGVVVHACGSDAMIHSARTALRGAGLPNRHFYSDAFVASN